MHITQDDALRFHHLRLLFPSLFLRLLTSQDNSHMSRLNCQLLMALSNSAEGHDDDELSYVGVPSDLKGTQAQTIKRFAG